MATTSLIFRFGPFTLDTEKGCLFKGETEVKLRPKVYETLKYLVQHPGRLIGKPELMQAVWPDSFVTDDSLVQCTLELRRALEDHGQRLLKTVPRRGYLFNSEITLGNEPLQTAATDELLGDARSSRRLARKRHDLPVPRTSLVGREEQIRAATGLLLREDIRLLTLTGPGGAGKTRLAVSMATHIADSFPAGVQFVSLASITEPNMVAMALADALDVQQVGGQTVPQLIGEKLKNAGPFLLVLDNFEQLLPAATVVAETLESCPSLKVLVTSRSSLRIYGEQEFAVSPLAQSAAMELFAQRAAAVWPGFALSAENAAVIREICARLDGLPLAIELAAARTKVLPPGAILERLQKPLQLLTGGAIDLPERQQTLRKAIDWSYSLLNEPEQRLFRRLSVFVGGCTLDGAEAVCDTRLDLGMDLVEGLSSLVDKNLIQRVDRSEAESRFSMLETIREYASERLIQSGEQAITRRAHAAYCLVVAEEGNPKLSQAERSVWLSRCDRESDNFRIALDWLFEATDLEWSLRLCVALFRFWDMREHLSEGRTRLETVLKLAGQGYPKERARVAMFLGALTSSQRDGEAAEKFLTHGLELYEDLGDDSGIAVSLNALAIAARDRGDYALAQSRFERSLACWRVLQDQSEIARCLHNLANVVKVRGDYARARWALQEATDLFEQLEDRNGAAWSMNQLGDVERAAGDADEARRCYERALLTFRQTGDPWGSARSLTDLGYMDCDHGREVEARAALREALQIFASLGHRRGIARALEGYAYLALSAGNPARALRLASAASNIRRVICAPLPEDDQVRVDRILLPARLALSTEEAMAASADGERMSLDASIRDAVQD